MAIQFPFFRRTQGASPAATTPAVPSFKKLADETVADIHQTLQTSIRQGQGAFGDVDVVAGQEQNFRSMYGRVVKGRGEQVSDADLPAFRAEVEKQLALNGLVVQGWAGLRQDSPVVTNEAEFQAFLNSPEFADKSSTLKAQQFMNGVYTQLFVPVLGSIYETNKDVRDFKKTRHDFFEAGEGYVRTLGPTGPKP